MTPAKALTQTKRAIVQIPKRRKRKPRNPLAKFVKAKPATLAQSIERVLIVGDLKDLTVEDRLTYYRSMCRSLKLNPYTGPFKYIIFDGKLTLYATKDCAEQLRKIHGVGCTDISHEIGEDRIIAKVRLRDRTGKVDVATGVVSTWKLEKDWNDRGGKYKKTKVDPTEQEFCNLIMKAETKAKRRGTLSIAGLGFLDESELEGLEYSEVTESGREIVVRGAPGTAEASQNVAKEKLQEHAAKSAGGGDSFAAAKGFDAMKEAEKQGGATLIPGEIAPVSGVQYKREVTIQYSDDRDLLWIAGEGWRHAINVLKPSGQYDEWSDLWTIPAKDAADVLAGLTEAGVKWIEGKIGDQLTDHKDRVREADAMKAADEKPKDPPAKKAEAPRTQTPKQGRAEAGAAAKGASTPTPPASSAGKAGAGSMAAPKANVPDLPAIKILMGPIEKIYLKTQAGEPLKTVTGGNPYVKVMVSGTMCFSFDNMKRSIHGQALEALHDILKDRVKVGDYARLITTTDAKGYVQITNVLQLGDLEWEENGDSVRRETGNLYPPR